MHHFDHLIHLGYVLHRQFNTYINEMVYALYGIQQLFLYLVVFLNSDIKVDKEKQLPRVKSYG